MSHLSTHLIAQLERVICNWPDFSDMSHFKSAMNRLRPYLSNEYEESGLHNLPGALSKVLKVQITRDQAAIEFENSDHEPFKATFKFESDHQWKLVALLPQCPMCFGAGTNDNERCELCGGQGWGVK